nr:E3 ubiquitin-protein ligase HERC2-like [Pongo pygmaeus]
MPRVVALTPTGAVQGWSGQTSSPGDENGSLCGRLGTEEFPVPSLNTRWHEIIGHIWASVSEKLSFKSKCEPFKDADTHSVTHRHSLSFGSLRMSCRKKMIDVAAGSTHCLALTEDSEVHSWRSNDQCQHFDTLRVTKPEPAALPGLDAKHIVGITCGPAQSCAWSSCSEWSIGLRVPLGVDICSVTFEQLDLLLQQVSEEMDGSVDWPPPQEKECMAVATLNLPRLQLHAAISHQVDPEFLGLGLGSVLLNSLKQTVVTLASSTGVLSTVHSASQAMLQSGWSLLLPTAEKQAWALSALLPCAVSGNEVNISPGRRFMIDLLVGSLMAAGGLESALHAAITAEIQDIEAKKEAQKEKEIDEQEANASAFHRSRTPLDKDLINTGICESSGKQCLPLVQLIQQRLSQCERMVSIVLEGPTRRRWEEVRLSL